MDYFSFREDQGLIMTLIHPIISYLSILSSLPCQAQSEHLLTGPESPLDLQYSHSHEAKSTLSMKSIT